MRHLLRTASMLLLRQPKLMIRGKDRARDSGNEPVLKGSLYVAKRTGKKENWSDENFMDFVG